MASSLESQCWHCGLPLGHRATLTCPGCGTPLRPPGSTLPATPASSPPSRAPFPADRGEWGWASDESVPDPPDGLPEYVLDPMEPAPTDEQHEPLLTPGLRTALLAGAIIMMLAVAGVVAGRIVGV